MIMVRYYEIHFGIVMVRYYEIEFDPTAIQFGMSLLRYY